MNITGTLLSKIRVLALSAVALLAATPAGAQIPLLEVHQNIPMAAVLDNPCTGAAEAIAFQGTTQLSQKVWQLANGNLRLEITEHTAVQGENTAVLLPPRPKYGFSGSGTTDVEFALSAISVMNYKKVVTEAADDNFHGVLELTFDPATLQLQVRLVGACANGQP
jgi:hypothetical protein